MFLSEIVENKLIKYSCSFIPFEGNSVRFSF